MKGLVPIEAQHVVAKQFDEDQQDLFKANRRKAKVLVNIHVNLFIEDKRITAQLIADIKGIVVGQCVPFYGHMPNRRHRCVAY